MRPKILIVDDSKTVRLIVRQAFKSYDCEIYEASTGVEGWTVAEQVLPDLILLDVTMPVMNGPALLLKLQAHPDLAAIPVIMLIVARDPHTVRQPGIHDHLSKPFQPADLLEKCRRLIKLQPLVPVG